ncbi:hypothetical protein ALNOE001_04780 [Candidatus Methanobinarius endosymbioticus]|uniref:DUF2116 family Zn-ribbon domain-containing protein n=1 Tax=Candidatus Methanobinarius endosymbioticus TaxID=2006182 RepID=A0A366MF33_9EURY|nr:hypothetical protein ALNOE001_04780 [Candidatus Methanobinarius endosymbioticus]
MTDMHKHCPVCNTPIPLDELTCSLKCQKTLEDQQSRVRKSRIMLYVVMIAFIAIFAYMMVFNE